MAGPLRRGGIWCYREGATDRENQWEQWPALPAVDCRNLSERERMALEIEDACLLPDCHGKIRATFLPLAAGSKWSRGRRAIERCKGTMPSFRRTTRRKRTY